MWLWQPLVPGAQQLTEVPAPAPAPGVWPDTLRGRPAVAHTFQAWAGPSWVSPVRSPAVYPDQLRGRPATAHTFQAFAPGPLAVPTVPNLNVWPDVLRGRPAIAHTLRGWTGALQQPPTITLPNLNIWPDAPQGRAALAHRLQAFVPGPIAQAIAQTLPNLNVWPDRLTGRAAVAHLLQVWGGPYSISVGPPPVVVYDPKAVLIISTAIEAILVENAINVALTGFAMAEPFRQGMLHPPLEAVAFRETGFVDVPTEFPLGVTFKMVSGSTVITGPATGDANGLLTYQWQTGNLDIPGTYLAYFIGTDAAGKTESLPRGHNLEIVVVPVL